MDLCIIIRAQEFGGFDGGKCSVGHLYPNRVISCDMENLIFKVTIYPG